MQKTRYTVNAFTANNENGNPAGVILNADALDEAQMLAIASHEGLSETAFIQNSSVATRKIRFFTPTTEVDLCGHATIAAWSLLYKLGYITAGEHTQETQAGILKVTVQSNGLTFMEQTKADFFEKINPKDITDLLAITSSDLHKTLKPQIVSTGIKDLLIPVINKSVLFKIHPNLEAIAQFSRQHDISGFHIFALLDQGESLAATRNFAPADGIPEECATGTSNGALLCYLKSVKALTKQNVYRIEQGETMDQLSYVYGTFKGEVVWVGGETSIN